MANTFQQRTPTCPHCGYAMDHDDMVDAADDVFEAAVNEQRLPVLCPSCDAQYWLRGGYSPHYTTAFSEEELS